MDKEKYLKFSARKELVKNYFSISFSALQDQKWDSGRIRSATLTFTHAYVCTFHKWPHLYRKFKCSKMKKNPSPHPSTLAQ